MGRPCISNATLCQAELADYADDDDDKSDDDVTIQSPHHTINTPDIHHNRHSLH